MPVLVLGMHRSGTSVLTRLVSLLGFDVGDDESLMGASASNRTGHWEVTRLTELNDDLLRHLGGRWSGPPAIEPGVLAELAAGEWGDRARAVLADTFAVDTAWVWKDPRVCVLVPFWRAVLGDEVGDDGLRAVVVVRHPLEVARSLEARNDLGVAYGVALWERYHRSVLAGAAGLPALVVAYDDLLADPVAVAGQLDRFLPGPPSRVDAEAVAAAVDPGQRHHDTAEVAAGLSPAAVQLLEATLAARGAHHVLSVDLPEETPGLQLAFDEHARMSRWHDLALQHQPLVEEAVAARVDLAALREERRQLLASRVIRTWLRLRGRLPPDP